MFVARLGMYGTRGRDTIMYGRLVFMCGYLSVIVPVNVSRL